MSSERADRLRSGGLAGLNGVMAVLCSLTALFVALLTTGLLLVAASAATGWPRGGYAIVSPVLNAHFDPGTVKVITGEDRCVVADGRRTCTHVTHTRTSAPPVTVTAESLVYGVAFAPLVLALAALGYGLVHAAACFAALARGRWFARRTITHLRDFAFGGLVFLAVHPFAPQLARALADAGERLVNPGATVQGGFTFGLDLGVIPTLLTVAYAVLLALITAVLAHARAVAEDHAQIV